MKEPVDSALQNRLKRGDPAAFGELYDQYHLSLYRYILMRVGNQQVAEDLTGEVFTRSLVALPGQSLQNVRAWLYQVARRLVIDHYRGREQTLPLEMLTDTPLSEDLDTLALEQQLTFEQVQQALTNLEETQRDVIILRFISGLSLKEVARILGSSVVSVKALQYRGLTRLRQALRVIE